MNQGVPPEIDAKFKAECANRMRFLNRLKAAPGQVNRALVTAFVQWKRWGNTPEEWSLFALPKDDTEFNKLSEEIFDFEKSMREGEQVK